MRDDLRKMALFGSGVAELTRNRAEQLARDLVERSKQNRDEILRLVKGEIQDQIAALGVPSKRDVERLQRRVERLEGQVKEARDAARDAARRGSPPSSPSTREGKPAGAKKSTRTKSTGAKTATSKAATAKGATGRGGAKAGSRSKPGAPAATSGEDS